MVAGILGSEAVVMGDMRIGTSRPQPRQDIWARSCGGRRLEGETLEAIRKSGSSSNSRSRADALAFSPLTTVQPSQFLVIRLTNLNSCSTSFNWFWSRSIVRLSA